MSETLKDNVILYDINTYTFPTWTNETNKDQNCYAKYQKSQTSNYNVLYKFGSWVKSFLRLKGNENSLKFIFTSSKPWNQWKLAVSELGSIAVLRENLIEYYENFENIEWRIEIQTQFVRICNIFFNQRSDMLIFTNEYGNIHFIDVKDGSLLFEYNETDLTNVEDSICKIFFLDRDSVEFLNKDADVVEIMMSLTYSGYLNVFTINKNKTVLKIYSQSLQSIIPNGIYCAEVDYKLEYLIIGSFASNSSYKQNSNGLYLFRILNTEPWIKHVKITNDYKSSKINDKINFPKIEYVTKLEISPDNKSLAAVYISGKIDLYSLPSLRLLNEWFMTEQPSYNEMNSDIIENPYELKRFKQIYHEADFRCVDIGWWNKEVLILTRGTGLLSLVSADNLSSLMGRNQQWLSPYPSIYQYQENEFIILDCSCVLSNQTSNYDSDDETQNQNLNESSELTQEENEDDDEDSWFSYLSQAFKSQTYNLTGLESFKITPKKAKILKRKFSILHIKSTTPEELFERKLNLEEYGEALQLAKTYNLDSDLVYQKQWRSKPISKSTIIDYLSKIKKRSWILHECEERLSPNLDTTKYLIDFGLHGTDLDSLIAINEHDDNKFVYSHQVDLDEDDIDEPFDKFNPQVVLKRKQKLAEQRDKKLKKLNPNNLTLMQKELCLIRQKLLNYMDRLNVYEQILGGPIKAAELFDSEKFKEIRSKTIFEVCLDYAREGNANAVEILFSYYSKELKFKQLDVLENFPETLEPDEYAKLLPRIENGKVLIFDEPDDIRNDKDWTELPEFSHVFSHIANKIDQNLSIENFYTVEKIQNWYLKRVNAIENLTSLIDVSLNFAELGIINGCKNLNEIIENLRCLSTLIYECKSNQANLNLEYIYNLNDLEKLCLIMEHSTTDQTLNDWLLPFVLRRPTLHLRENLLREFLLRVSQQDLNPCLKMFHLKLKLKSDHTVTASVLSNSNLFNEINLISIIIDCFYVNERPEQVELCSNLINEILNLIKPEQLPNNQIRQILNLSQEQLKQIKQVQEHIRACELFKKYGVPKTLFYIKQSCSSTDACHDALVKLTWFASKRTNHLKINEWIELMKDLNYLQNNLYKNLINYHECTEIFLTSLLGSRNLENIKLASDWLKDIYIVDKKAAVQLGIKSAQDYFNSSSSYLDPDMDFSKACLNQVQSLITDSKNTINELKNDPIIESCSKMIDYEFDLISAMKLIVEFDYNILPAQVRLSENRFHIIKDIIKKNENSYKSYESLIKLAKFLHIRESSDNSDMLEVSLLIAEHALLKKNIYILTQMCSGLIKANYEPAWLCVYKLAQLLCLNLIENYKIEIKIHNDEFKPEEEVLYSDLRDKYLFLAISEHKFNFKALSFGLSKDKTLQNLAEIEKLLSFVLTNCTVDFVQEILYQKLNIENKIISLELEEYEEFDLKPGSNLNFDLEFNKYFINDLDSICLDDFKVKNFKLKKILQNLAEKNSSNFVSLFNLLVNLETKISFSYLLNLSEDDLSLLFDDFKVCKLNSTESYEFLLHLFSLNLIGDLFESDFENKSIIYELDLSILKEYIDKLDKNVFTKCPSSFKLYKKIDKLYMEFNQKNQLENLNAGIDLNRFETDQVYKEETILGLSMDINTFQLACSLAKFYSFDLWKVYMSFTEYLLSENDTLELNLDQIEAHLTPLTEVLRQDMAQFKKNMQERVLGFIDGKNLEKLTIYFSLLGDAESELHAKNLKKIKLANLENSFDYKKMLDNPFEYIEPFLDDSNLQLFSNIVQKLPNKNLNPSQLHVIWCLKKFWSKIDIILNKTKEEDSVWSNQENLNILFDNFDSLNESIKKLDLNTDFLFFVKELTLNQKSCTKLNIQIRKDLIKKINKIFKTQKLELTENVNNELTKIHNHLKLVDSVEKLLQSNKNNNNKYYKEYLDIELGKFLLNEKLDADKNIILQDYLINMFFDAYSIETLNQMIKTLSLNENINVKKLIELCLNKICDGLKNKKDNQEYSNKLNVLLETISNYLTNSNDSNFKNQKSKKQASDSARIISDEDVMECMRTFCNDQQIDINIRLLILEELKRIIKNMKDEDLMLLLVYKTNAILATCDFFNKKCDTIDSELIENDEKRKELLFKYLDLSESDQHYKSLLNLIKIWPLSEETSDLNNKPLISILISLLLNSDDFYNLINEVKDEKNFNLSEKDLSFIKKQLMEGSDWNEESGMIKIKFFKMCLIFRTKDNVDFIKRFMSSIELECFSLMINEFNFDLVESSKSFELLVNDQNLMNLLLKDNFFMDFVNTNFYSIFLYYLVRNESKEKLYEIVKLLKKNGYLIESAKLLAETENVYSSYRCLSVSLALIDKFNH